MPSATARDIIFSFDTTGSMYPCLTQVRRVVTEVVRRMFDTIPGLRVGIIAHGDYCDGLNAIRKHPLTDDQRALILFINSAPATSGGDPDENYEDVLYQARGFNWLSDKSKALVLIGDALPHPVGYRFNGQTNHLNWRNEAKLLVEAGVAIYPIQAMGRRHADSFYNGLADISGTPKLELEQFADIADILEAVTHQSAGQLDEYKAQVKARKHTLSPGVLRTLDQLAGKPEKLSQRTVTVGSRFQVIDVDINSSIKEFVEEQGLEFEKGRGFYEFTKSEIIQDYKEVVAQNLKTGAIITGKRARDVLGVEFDNPGRQKPDSETHRGFVQSTSVNRKLIGGTKFLYEVKETV